MRLAVQNLHAYFLGMPSDVVEGLIEIQKHVVRRASIRRPARAFRANISRLQRVVRPVHGVRPVSRLVPVDNQLRLRGIQVRRRLYGW
jgi:hypothetical protein